MNQQIPRCHRNNDKLKFNWINSVQSTGTASVESKVYHEIAWENESVIVDNVS